MNGLNSLSNVIKLRFKYDASINNKRVKENIDQLKAKSSFTQVSNLDLLSCFLLPLVSRVCVFLAIHF